MDIRWDIRREGRSWTADEFRSRVDLRPEKLEVWKGKPLRSHEERLAPGMTRWIRGLADAVTRR